MKRFSLAIMASLLALLFMIMGASTAFGQATITTDKTDYAPGDTVLVTGAGWLPDETVSLTFQGDPLRRPPVVVSAVADASGAIANHEFVVDTLDVNTTYAVAAVGQASGYTAQATFTDSPCVASVTVGPQSPYPGQVGGSATYQVEVQLASGWCWGNVQLGIGGLLPPGHSVSFSPNPIYLTSGQKGTVTLTISGLGCAAVGSYSFTVRAWGTWNTGDNATGYGGLTVAETVPPVPNVNPLPEVTQECRHQSVPKPTAWDNCSGTIYATSSDLQNYVYPGDYTIHWTYRDAAGNESYQTQALKVRDTQPPYFVRTPPSISVETGSSAGSCAVYVSTSTLWDNAYVEDYCGRGHNESATGIPPGNMFPVGTTYVTWTTTDPAGNSSTSTQSVYVRDTTPPKIYLSDYLSFGTGPGATTCARVVSDAELASVTAEDNCGGNVTITRTGVPPGNLFPIGMTIVSYQARDAAGNTSTRQQRVTVYDTTPPTPAIAQLPELLASCGVTVPVPTATDNCPGQVHTYTSDPLTYTAQGTFTVHWTYVDANGNGATQQQTVIVHDTTPPDLVAPGPINRQAPSDAATCSVVIPDQDLGWPTASDNCAGQVAITRTGVPAGNLFPVGNTTVTWSATDEAGNQATGDQTVTVTDGTPPLVSLNGSSPMTVECHAAFTDPGAVAIDACAGPLPVTVTGTVNPNVPGDYVLGYQATDPAGNTGGATRTVRVVDTTPPVIAVSVTPNELWPPTHTLLNVHATVQVADACDPAPSFSLASITLRYDGDQSEVLDGRRPEIVGADLGTPDLDFQLRAEKGTRGCGVTFTIVYTATDPSGNTATASATVRVPHDRRGQAAIAGNEAGPGHSAQGTSLALVIPSIVQAPSSEEQPDDVLGGAAPPLFIFDARTVNPAQTWMGNSAGLVAPSGVAESDLNGDGYEDLVLTYEAEALAELLSLPVTTDDPMTFYYRALNGTGYEVAVPLPGTLANAAARSAAANLGSAAQGGSESAIPRETRMGLGAPNPSRGSMTFALDLASALPTRVEIYDLRGAHITTLLQGVQPAGRYRIAWNGTDHAGRRVASGVYLVRAEAGAYHVMRKAVLIR